VTEERKKILQMVESGTLSAEEGAQLLELVSDSEGAAGDATPPQEGVPPEEGDPSDEASDAYRYWWYPLWGGTLLMVLGGAVISAIRPQGRGSGWVLLCGWVPLVLGLVVVTLAAWARNAHWIHLRVKDQHNRVSLSFPLPLSLTAAVLRVARWFVPKLRETSVDEAILALRDELKDGQPVTIEVQDDEEGEQVRIEIR
jgi:hypothetical protein